MISQKLRPINPARVRYQTSSHASTGYIKADFQGVLHSPSLTRSPCILWRNRCVPEKFPNRSPLIRLIPFIFEAVADKGMRSLTDRYPKATSKMCYFPCISQSLQPRCRVIRCQSEQWGSYQSQDNLWPGRGNGSNSIVESSTFEERHERMKAADLKHLLETLPRCRLCVQGGPGQPGHSGREVSCNEKLRKEQRRLCRCE